MRVLRYILRGAMLLLALVALVATAGYFYLRSDSGLDWLTHQINQRASSDDQRIALSGLRGHLLHDITLANATLADRDGVWLELQGVHAIWSPRALLRKQAPLTLLTAEKIHVLRNPLPAPTKAAQPSANKPLSLQELAIYLPRTLQITTLQLDEAVAGMAQQATITGKGDATRYALDMATLHGIPTTLAAVLQPGRDDFAASVHFTEAEGGMVAALAGLPNNVALALDTEVTATMAGDARMHAATLKAGTLEAKAEGTYSVSGNKADLTLSVTAPDMDIIQALSATPMHGSATLNVLARGTPDAMQLTITAATPQLTVQDQRIEAFTLQAEAELNPSAWGRDSFAVDGKIQAEGHHNGEAFSLLLQGAAKDGTVQIPELTAHYGPQQLAGSLTAHGTVQRFDVTSKLGLTAPEGDARLALNGTVDTEAARYKGAIDGAFTHQQQRFSLLATLDADAATAKLSKFVLTGPGVTARGAATIAIPEQLADAKITLDASDLTPLGKLLHQPLSGALTAEIVLAHQGSAQHANIIAHANALGLPGMRIATATIQATLANAKALEGIDLALDATGLAADAVQITTTSLRARGSLKTGLETSLSGTGTHTGKPWTLAVRGKAQQPSAQHYRFDLTTLDGSYADTPLRMEAPTTLQHQPNTTSLSPLTLQLADGTVRAEGMLEHTKLRGALRISSLALQKLPIHGLPEATLNASLDMGGTANAPILAWQASSTGLFDAMPFTVDLKGGWKEGLLQSHASLQAEAAKSEVNLALPAHLSLQPFATDLGDRTALKGAVTASVPLAMFNARLRPQGHRLEGLFGGEAKLAGTLGNPYFDGAFSLANGRYDHNPTGICLRDMQASISGNRQAVRLDTFSATDSDKKRLTAHAALALSGTPTLTGDANFDHFKLFCGGMMTGQIDGDIAASGTTRAMNVAGNLILGPLNIQIPGARVASDIPQVEMQWIRPGEATTEPEPTPGVVALDITVAAPKQLFVRGRGLDAEFGGTLAITGTATSPKIEGQFDKQRGNFILLDRNMALDTATIRFQGPIPPSPFLNVVASTPVNGTTITVTLAGNAAKPTLTLSSSPQLPQDEALALLLFGRQLNRISPFEALQLAQATRTLAGLDGGGPGVIDTIRDQLGLDRLQVGADDDNNVNVSTGKYVTDDVYVGVVQGTRPEDREVVTEITLTPSVSGKTAVDSVGNQSVGMEWKRDY